MGPIDAQKSLATICVVDCSGSRTNNYHGKSLVLLINYSHCLTIINQEAVVSHHEGIININDNGVTIASPSTIAIASPLSIVSNQYGDGYTRVNMDHHGPQSYWVESTG